MKKHPMPGARERARRLRREMTDAERRVWSLIRSRRIDGFRFRRQVPLGGYIADFVCHEARLAVEIDGGQHDPESADERKRTRFLESQGYRVLRFWNTDALQNPEGVWMAIAEALKALPLDVGGLGGGDTAAASPAEPRRSPPPRPSPIKGEGACDDTAPKASSSKEASLVDSPSPSMGEGGGEPPASPGPRATRSSSSPRRDEGRP